MNAVVMDGAIIGENSIVGAAAFVKAKAEMPANHLIIGSPARAIRELSEQELAWKQQGTREYQVLVERCKLTMHQVEPLREQVRAQLGAAGLGGRPLHLLAMSLGAMVAIAWAQRHPGELAGMVLINTSVRPLNPFWQRLRPRAWPVLLRSQIGLMSLPEREAAMQRKVSGR